MTPIRHMICAVALLVLGSACSENPVGRACFIGIDGDAGIDQNQNVVSSPALEWRVSLSPKP